MEDFEKLTRLTAEFFRRHASLESGQTPVWSDPKRIEGSRGLAPNGDRTGCYALFSDDALIYIGVGRSTTRGCYGQNAIDRRIRKHILRVNPSGTYTLQDKWPPYGVTSLRTIALADDIFYMASALEEFLIHSLAPVANRQGKGRVAALGHQ